MSRKLRFVQQVVNKVVSMEGVDDTAENVQTEEVRKSADATIEVRQLKLENEAQVRISSLEQDLVEIEGLHEATDELEAAQEEVGDLIVATESYLERGGLTKDAAFFANIALKNATKRVFLDAAMPSMESFAGSSADRMDMTVVSLEGFKETAQKIWKAIVETVKGVIAKVTAWFKKLFDANAKDAAALKETVEAVTKAEKAELELGEDAAKYALIGLADGKGKWAVSGEEATFKGEQVIESTEKHLELVTTVAVTLAKVAGFIEPSNVTDKLDAQSRDANPFIGFIGADNQGTHIPTLGGYGVRLDTTEAFGINPDTLTVEGSTSDKLAKDDFIKRANDIIEILTKVVPESQKRVEETIKIAEEVSKLSDDEIIERIAKLNDTDLTEEKHRARMFAEAKNFTGRLAKLAGSSAIMHIFTGVNKAARGYIAVGGKFVK